MELELINGVTQRIPLVLMEKSWIFHFLLLKKKEERKEKRKNTQLQNIDQCFNTPTLRDFVYFLPILLHCFFNPDR